MKQPLKILWYVSLFFCWHDVSAGERSSIKKDKRHCSPPKTLSLKLSCGQTIRKHWEIDQKLRKQYEFLPPLIKKSTINVENFQSCLQYVPRIVHEEIKLYSSARPWRKDALRSKIENKRKSLQSIRTALNNSDLKNFTDLFITFIKCDKLNERYNHLYIFLAALPLQDQNHNSFLNYFQQHKEGPDLFTYLSAIKIPNHFKKKRSLQPLLQNILNEPDLPYTFKHLSTTKKIDRAKAL